MIDKETEVKVLSVSGDRVRLGITAPEEIDICRKEIQAEREDGRRADA